MKFDRRTYYRQGLHPAYLKGYDLLCTYLPDYWAPTCGVRTFQEQARLFAQGRTRPGNIVTHARTGLSLHNYGLASDWDYFPDGVYTPITAKAPLWNEYKEAVERAGLRCLDFEKPHNEFPLKTPILEVFLAFKNGGKEAVDQILEREKKK